MSKYLVVARGYNEPDNNTPSDVILARIIECEPKECREYGEKFEKELLEDYPIGVDIEFYEVGMLNEWRKVSVIW